MNFNRIKLYGKTLLLKRGVMVSAIITFRCNLHCPYCILNSTGGKPTAPESTLTEWKDLFTKFTVKIREVIVTGGEPTLYPHFAELVSWLLAQGYHVKVQTNLTNPHLFYLIKPSHRLRIVATYHHQEDPQKFNTFYQIVKQLHRIDAHELGTKALPYSTLMPILGKEGLPKHSLRITPDRKIQIGCLEAINNNL